MAEVWHWIGVILPWLILVVCSLVGLVGTLLPAVPGGALILLGTWVFALWTGFQRMAMEPPQPWLLGWPTLTLVTLRGAWGWTLFGVIWAFAIVGIVTTVAFLNAPRWLTASIYVVMGWLAIVAIKPLVAALPTGGMVLLAAGGLSYTGGVVFYVWERLPFNHAVWHLFVLGGSACHYFCMMFYVLPMNPT